MLLEAASSYNAIYNNTIDASTHGIGLRGSFGASCDRNRIMNNTIEQSSSRGLYFEYAAKNTVAYNNVSQNGWGIYIAGTNAVNNWIFLNNFSANTLNAYSFWSGNNNWFNTSMQMTYYYNGGWYTGYLGNYWSNYSGIDADGNGGGDTNYLFNFERDRYPLVTSPGEYATDMIPEFPGLLVPVLGLMLVVLVSALLRSVTGRAL